MTEIEFFATVNGLLSIAISALAFYAVVSKRISDGLVMKAGLILLSLGHFAAAAFLLDGSSLDDTVPVLRSQFCVRVGYLLFVVSALYTLNLRRKGR